MVGREVATWATLAPALLLTACGSGESALGSDVSAADLGLVDVGRSGLDLGFRDDSGVFDLGAIDSGLRDIGAQDAGSADAGTRLDMGGNRLCPPSPPFGTGVGDTFVDIRLPDCDGQMHSLHEACGRRASYFFVYADW